MRDLPGFYWDEARQRYFPEASRRKTSTAQTLSPVPPHAITSTPVRRVLRPRCDSFSALKEAQRTCSNLQRDQGRHSLMMRQIASASSRTSIQVPIVYTAPITSLKISNPLEGSSRRDISLGDRQGWCYVGDSVDSIVAEFCLRSEISSIQKSEETTVYTSFGPNPQLLIQNETSLESFLLRPPHLQDVRTSQLQGRSLTLGMRKKALHFPDLENARTTRSLETQGDVFALYRDRHDVWAGTRNGTVRVFDLRSNQVQHALGARFHSRRTTVTYIQRLRDYQLLVAVIDGNLEIFDIRFARHSAPAVPLLAFTGHSNTVTHNLAVSVDPLEDILVAAGEDRRIRAWSLRTGNRLEALQTTTDGCNPFSRTFEHPIYAMQITSDSPAGALWVASGPELDCFELGKHVKS